MEMGVQTIASCGEMATSTATEMAASATHRPIGRRCPAQALTSSQGSMARTRVVSS